ncbi:unnamed protein product [Acanthoscelides obtectus]|uniref:Uncharacterized protein n=1 Tax=Acanthoscelides obtectus TaxID=200917 RepID=A0A9P0KXI8_ACAOB|nr:unnamed protein product [Acanthoscelides obtectus]CAK1630037.1 hypothetical protein AOBTE_LOCUS6121 [Acanthoscelides obtectus]
MPHLEAVRGELRWVEGVQIECYNFDSIPERA